MDLLRIGHFYINHIFKVAGQSSSSASSSLKPSRTSSSSVIPGTNINVLLLDDYTTSIISIVSSQSELLNNNIFLIDKLANQQRDKLRHLNCIVFISPSTDSINWLCDELKFPKYRSYSVFFSNFLTKSQLEKIAECDDLETITHIQEIFWDYLVINQDLFQLYSGAAPLNQHQGSLDFGNGQWNLDDRSINSKIVSLLLSLKSKPIIRFEGNSRKALRCANDIYYELTNPNSNSFQLFNNFPKSDTKPLLLIMDRKNDPLTPLLSPWTYQAMIHEYLTITKNIVDLSPFVEGQQAKNDDEVTQMILNVENDKFFQESMFLNFADLSEKIKLLVANYKNKTNSSNSLNSIEDLKNFLQEFPEFKKLSHNVNKHITITGELDKKIQLANLWEVSEVEQNLSIGKESDYSHHNEDYTNVFKLLVNGKLNTTNDPNPYPIPENYKIKLVLIYALKYENYSQNQIKKLVDILKSQGITGEKTGLIDFVLKYSGIKKRLYNDTTTTATSGNSSAAPNLPFVDNNANNANLSIFTPLKNTNNLILNLKKLGAGAADNHNNSKNGAHLNLSDLDYEEESNNSIYMQHRPRLLYVLQDIFSKRLNGGAFPILNPYSNSSKNPNSNNSDNNYGSNSTGNSNGLNHINHNTNTLNNEKFQDIIIFFLDGITYEESRLVSLLNAKYKEKGIRLVIGSDMVVNSDQYMNGMLGMMVENGAKNGGRGMVGKTGQEDRLLSILGGGGASGSSGGAGLLGTNRADNDSFFGDNLL